MGRRFQALPYWIILVGALFINAAIFFPAFDNLDGSLSWASTLVYLFFKPLCHQQPARCFWLSGLPLPVCVRCVGIYIGGLAGVIVLGLRKGTTCRDIPSELWIGLGFLPLFLDGVLNLSGLIASPAWIRLLTGLIAGGTMAAVLIPAAALLMTPQGSLYHHDLRETHK